MERALSGVGLQPSRSTLHLGRPVTRLPPPISGFIAVACLAILIHPSEVAGQTFEHFLGMTVVPYDPNGSCADMPEYCGPSATHTGGLGLRVLQLYWMGDYTEAARFTLHYPQDWTVYEIEFCDGVTPVSFGTRPGEPFEFDFGGCREQGPVKLGRIVLNVRSRGRIYASNQEVRQCTYQWTETLNHGWMELGLPCEINYAVACSFFGPYLCYGGPFSLSRVFIAGAAGSDTVSAAWNVVCDYGGPPCYAGPSIAPPWVEVDPLGGPPEYHSYRLRYAVESFPPGRYQGPVIVSGVCGAEGCLGVDVQVIEEVSGNRQPVARIRPFGAATNPVQFDGTGSFDLDGSPLTYFWDFGDGESATGSTAVHSFTIGPATVTLVVHDGVLQSTSDSLSFEVVPPGMPTAVGDPSPAMPLAFTLEVRNPMVPGHEALRFTLPSAAWVRLELFDAGGRHVRTPVAGLLPAGRHAVGYEVIAGRQPKIGSGIFFVRLADGSGNVAVRKLLVLR